MSSPHPGQQPPSGPPQSYGPQYGPAGQPPTAPGQYGGRPTGLGAPAPTRSNSSVLIATILAVLVIGGGLSAWLLSSPSYDRTTAQGAAEAFADAVNSRSIDAAKSLVCSSDRYGMNGGSTTQLLSLATLKVNGVESSGDKGTARFEIVTNLGTEEQNIPLQRDDESGQWEVCFSKASEN